MIKPSIKDALNCVNPRWNDALTDTFIRKMKQKKRIRTIRRVVILVASLAPIVVLSLLSLEANKTDDSQVISEVHLIEGVTASKKIDLITPLSNATIVLADGSFASPVGDMSRLVVRQMTDQIVSLSVEAGQIDFEVTPKKGRVFNVHVGEVVVSVLGTSFSVAREQNRARVIVHRGQVEVKWPGGSTVLEDNMENVFPPKDADKNKLQIAKSEAISAVRLKKSHQDWRKLTRNGDFEKAAKALNFAKDVKDTVEDLLLAADAMRLSGHPEKALSFLENISKNHRSDPRVSLAEFTRGRVLLLQLGRPSSAAEAFNASRRRAPKGSLAQDAMAREVEAWSRAGEADKARQTALEYQQKYPGGRRLKAVRRFGEL